MRKKLKILVGQKHGIVTVCILALLTATMNVDARVAIRQPRGHQKYYINNSQRPQYQPQHQYRSQTYPQAGYPQQQYPQQNYPQQQYYRYQQPAYPQQPNYQGYQR